MPDTPLNHPRYGEFPPNFYPPYSDLNGVAQPPYTAPQPHPNVTNTPQRAAFNFDLAATMQTNQGSPQAPLGPMDAGVPGSRGSVRPRTVDLDEDDEEPANKKSKSTDT